MEPLFVSISTVTIPEGDFSLELVGPFDTYEDAQDFVDALPDSYPVPTTMNDMVLGIVGIHTVTEPTVIQERIDADAGEEE